jgi:glyoxylase-like metal-dependent hydrolase (beta-lactamase superfamily II)
MLINGGVSMVVPDLLRQFEMFYIDESRITKMLLLHSHFDHIGVAPYLKRRHPELNIYASERAVTVLTNPDVIRSVNAASQYAIENSANRDACRDFDLAWETSIQCEALTEGDRIDLGNMSVEIYATPGHSPCSISAYVPELKALFPSDAGGLPLGEKIITYGTSDFATYIQSLEKLTSLKTRLVCSDHYGCVCEDEAASFIQDSIAVARQRVATIASTYQRTGDLDETAGILAGRFRDEGNFNLVPFDVFVAAQRSMVSSVVGK